MLRRVLPLLLPLGALVLAAGLVSPRRSTADDRTRSPLIDAPTRASIERGLRFLARTQVSNGDPAEDGAWLSAAGQKVNDDYYAFPRAERIPHVGVTALGILAFLAAGHVPGRGPYGDVVNRAVDFILRSVQKDGFIARNQTRMYSHAFATLALAEVYGMSREPLLRSKLEDAVDLTVKCQNETGGWRYVPFTVDSDMSVTVCQIVALRAAMNVGIRVKAQTIDRALHYVIDSAITEETRTMQENEIGGFRYQPATTKYNRTSFPLTAAGLTSLFQAGIYDDPALSRYATHHGFRLDPMPSIQRAVQFMEDSYEETARVAGGKHYFFFYGNYYAAQAMYNIGGTDPARWARWYDRVRHDLLAREVRGPGVGARGEEGWWESNIGDTHTFGTAVAILIMSMPFDYLPIHQK